MELKGKVMALDYGSRRVGWAISDSTQTIVDKVGTIEYWKEEVLWSSLESLFSDFIIIKTVVGYPINMDDTIGQRARITDEFIGKLEKRFSLPVEKWDERMTSVMAEKMIMRDKKKVRRNKARIDSLAAGIILDEFLICES